MATVADIAKWVRPAVPGCPEPLILDALKRAAEDYCTQAKVVFRNIPVTTQVGVNAYALPLDDEFDVVELEWVKRTDPADGSRLDASSKFEVEQKESQSGTPRRYYLNGLNQLVLHPTPEGIETFAVEVQAAPTELSVDMPDELMLLKRYTAVAQGAKAILFTMENVPWTDLNKAALAQVMFDRAVEAEALKLAKGGAQKRLRTKLTTF